MKQLLILMGLFIMLAGTFILVKAFRPASRDIAELKVGQAAFRVEIADTPVSRARGLSGRSGLANDQGMFFIFESLNTHQFWMKDMRFPIDIIWIQGSEVVGITSGAEPEAGPDYTIYAPPAPVDMVLEINAGLSQKLGIKVGDSVSLNK